MSNISPKRGDLFYADLDPVVGSEQGGIRPILIIQNNSGNRYSPTVIVAAITSSTEKTILPTHYILNKEYGLDNDSVLLLEQIRTIDKQRLINYICTLNKNEIQLINRVLAISVGLKVLKED